MGKKWTDKFFGHQGGQWKNRDSQKSETKSQGKQQPGGLLPKHKRTCPVPKVKDPYNISPIKSQNCYNCVSPILPRSKKSINVSYSSPDLTLYIGCMESKLFAFCVHAYLKQEEPNKYKDPSQGPRLRRYCHDWIRFLHGLPRDRQGDKCLTLLRPRGLSSSLKF